MMWRQSCLQVSVISYIYIYIYKRYIWINLNSYIYIYITSVIIGAGAKGNFSGGFDVAILQGIQEGKSMHAAFIYIYIYLP